MDPDLVDELPKSRYQHVAVASVMLGIGLLAFASMSFAVKSTGVVDSWQLAALVGAFWGCLIVTVDRVLLVNMSRHPQGGFRNAALAFCNLAVRGAMAAGIGFVISMPLVLQLFAPGIAARIEANQAQARIDAQESLDVEFADIADKEKELEAAQGVATDAGFYDPAAVNPAYRAAEDAKNAAGAECTAANAAAEAEAAGSGGTGRAGYGEEWQRLKGIAEDKCAVYRDAEAEFNRIAAETRAKRDEEIAAAQAAATATVERLTAELKVLRGKRDGLQQDIETSIAESDGLQARIDALYELSDESRGVRHARYGLMFVLIAIEVVPILSKFFRQVMPPDIHDGLVAKREAAKLGHEDLGLAEQHKAARIRSRAVVDAAQDWRVQTAQASHEVNAVGVAYQKEVELKRLEAWRRAEEANSAEAVARAAARLNRTAAHVRDAAQEAVQGATAPQAGLGLQTP
jgi:hypothetical protein